MKLKYKQIDSLPPLAWLAEVNNGIATIIHGKSVETKNLFFAAGAWAGDFRAGDFLESEWFCGTGAKLDAAKIIFSTPTHVISGLFVSPESGGVLVSNSLHFLCAYAGYHLDPQYLNYETDFNSILLGIDKYTEQIRVLKGDDTLADVRVYYYRNITVKDNNHLEITIKAKVDPFKSFSDYYTRLCNTVESMIKNAQDEERKHRYGIVTTISKGYDAPCCAVIARKFGCDTAVTFKAIGKYAEDSGVEIARKLGYTNIIERNADAYMEGRDLAEAEAISSGALGTDFQFSVFDDVYQGNLVFIGERGDKIWAREFPTCNDNFEFDDIISGIGASERKLWGGYILVPMPLIGASSWTSIQRISQSCEMKDWQLNTDYDRPIPRRILEEAGVERNAFGMQKNGAGIVLRYDWGARAKRRMSKSASKSFDAYLKSNRRPHIFQLVNYFWKARKIYLKRIGIKITDKTSKTTKSQISNATTVRYLIPWAADVIRNRYELAINR